MIIEMIFLSTEDDRTRTYYHTIILYDGDSFNGNRRKGVSHRKQI